MRPQDQRKARLRNQSQKAKVNTKRNIKGLLPPVARSWPFTEDYIEEVQKLCITDQLEAALKELQS